MEEGSIGNRRCTNLAAMLCGRTGLLVLVSGYAVLGAFLFKTLEDGNEENLPVHIQRSREDCLRELWLITERLNVLYEKNWTRLVTEQLKRFEKAVIESSKSDNISHSYAPHWTFGGALLYSLTLLTTVGYGKLSPRTTWGKAAAMIYAVIGVPLMLVLLSALGSLLAGGAKRGYIRMCCKHNSSTKFAPNVGYHRAPSSPSAKHFCQSTNEDSSSVQLIPMQCIQNNINHKPPHLRFDHGDHEHLPKKALLATVRSCHTRGRCVQTQVRQMLAEPNICPTHSYHNTSPRFNAGCAISLSDVEETDDNDETDAGLCTHGTPSRIPLIWREPEQHEKSPNHTSTLETTPTVPASIVLIIFVVYVCLGAAAFASTSDWSFLDATYFCFIALSTIGIGDKLPQNNDYYSQVQLLACCLYLFLGLVIVAMCFSLIHDEVASKCKQFASSMKLTKH